MFTLEIELHFECGAELSYSVMELYGQTCFWGEKRLNQSSDKL